MFNCHRVWRHCIFLPWTFSLVKIFVSDGTRLNTLLPYVIIKVSLHQDVNNHLVSGGLQFHNSSSFAWIELIIRAANNLLGFILTTSFGVEYNLLNFRREYPFIVLLNVS